MIGHLYGRWNIKIFLHVRGINVDGSLKGSLVSNDQWSSEGESLDWSFDARQYRSKVQSKVRMKLRYKYFLRGTNNSSHINKHFRKATNIREFFGSCRNARQWQFCWKVTKTHSSYCKEVLTNHWYFWEIFQEFLVIFRGVYTRFWGVVTPFRKRWHNSTTIHQGGGGGGGVE